MEKLVNLIELDAPKGALDTRTLIDLTANLDGRAILNNLPKGVSENSLVGFFKMTLLSEAATDTYAASLIRAGDNFKQDWLKRFVVKVWQPDEQMHYLPHKQVLLKMGFFRTGIR